jgi:hypothetical protein
VEDLDSRCCQADVDGLVDQLVRHAVVVVVDLDMVVDVGLGLSPLGVLKSVGRQWAKCRLVQRLIQRTP